MPRRRPFRVAAIALALLLAAFALRVALWRPSELVGESPNDGYLRMAGAVHVHTTRSDGGGTPEEVIEAARAAGLGFVVITDHNNLDAKRVEGYHDGVLAIVGTELSTTAGHILGLGLADPAYRFSGDGRDGLEDIRDASGFAFAAHPLSTRDDLRFTGWDLPGPWGVELLNGDTEWRRAGVRNLMTAALYGLNQRYALLQALNPPDEMLARWDRLLARRDVPAIVGTDAHSRLPLTKTRALRWPSYESLFTLARNHVLLDSMPTGEARRDTRAVLEALRRGRSYVALDALAPANAFAFAIAGPSGRATMGDALELAPDLRARAYGRMPRGARVALLRDGQLLGESADALDAALPGPGVYRVEVRVPGWRVPWILTNAIAVFDQATLETRSSAAGWPVEPEAPPARAVIDAFDGHTIFVAGHDPASAMDEPLLDTGGGVAGTGAARIAFTLGEPTAAKPDVFCAIINRDPRDLTGAQGLTFAIRGDGEYRIWVQVRDENPASKDEGTEWWFASVRTSKAWRKVAIPFARFRSTNPRTDGRLDLDQVRALVFVLDKGAEKPGTSGTIWIDDLATY